MARISKGGGLIRVKKSDYSIGGSYFGGSIEPFYHTLYYKELLANRLPYIFGSIITLSCLKSITTKVK